MLYPFTWYMVEYMVLNLRGFVYTRWPRPTSGMVPFCFPGETKIQREYILVTSLHN